MLLKPMSTDADDLVEASAVLIVRANYPRCHKRHRADYA
jgi:hypothetical protein